MAPAANRPKRKYIPVTVVMAVYERQHFRCGWCACLLFPIANPYGIPHHIDHEPALRLRDINRRGTDYIPPQNDPAYLQALCEPCHHAKTHGKGATTAGTDVGKIKKERKRNRKPRIKCRWPKARKIPSRKMRP